MTEWTTNNNVIASPMADVAARPGPSVLLHELGAG